MTVTLKESTLMSGKQMVGIACFVLAVALFANGMHTMSRGRELIDLLWVLVPALMALILGLMFIRKQKPS